jgi:hypothetical protein
MCNRHPQTKKLRHRGRQSREIYQALIYPERVDKVKAEIIIRIGDYSVSGREALPTPFPA